jgi:hypothetical protein
VCAVHALDYYEVLGLQRSADEQVRADALAVRCATCDCTDASTATPAAVHLIILFLARTARCTQRAAVYRIAICCLTPHGLCVPQCHAP